VKNTDCAHIEDYDAGKKMPVSSGILSLTAKAARTISVTTANVTDRQGALETIGQNKEHLSEMASVQAAKRNELRTFQVILCVDRRALFTHVVTIQPLAVDTVLIQIMQVNNLDQIARQILK